MRGNGLVAYSLLEPSTAMLDRALLRGMLTELKAETAVEFVYQGEVGVIVYKH